MLMSKSFIFCIVFLFPGVTFCPVLSHFLFSQFFHPFLCSLESFVYHCLYGLFTLCPALRPSFFLLVIYHFFPPGPFLGHPSSFWVFDGHPLSMQPLPLLFLGEKLQSQLPSESFKARSCHTLGSRENLLSALMPPSTPLPPHPREGADRSPGPLHSRQVPDRGLWGGWHRPPSRALRLHIWLWGRLS